MFVLSTLEDKVRLDPADLGRPTEQAVTAVLEKSYLDRVVPDLGLAVTLYDILSIGEGHIHHSDGGAHYDVVFRLVVFRPFPGELLAARIAAQDETEGVRASVGFFADVLIPPYALPEPRSWDPQERAWCWEVEGAGGSRLFFETGAAARVRVSALRFSAPPTPAAQAEDAAAGRPVAGTAAAPHRPMEVLAKADGDGLGMAHWYDDDGM